MIYSVGSRLPSRIARCWAVANKGATGPPADADLAWRGSHSCVAPVALRPHTTVAGAVRVGATSWRAQGWWQGAAPYEQCCCSTRGCRSLTRSQAALAMKSAAHQALHSPGSRTNALPQCRRFHRSFHVPAARCACDPCSIAAFTSRPHHTLNWPGAVSSY